MAGDLEKSVGLKIFTSLKHFHHLPDELAVPLSSCRSSNSDYLHIISNSKWFQISFFWYVDCLKNLRKCVEGGKVRERDRERMITWTCYSNTSFFSGMNGWKEWMNEWKKKDGFLLHKPFSAFLDFQVIIHLHRPSLLPISWPKSLHLMSLLIEKPCHIPRR